MDPWEMAGSIAGSGAGQTIAIEQCIQTHYWSLEMIQFVLIAVFGAALYGFVNEMVAPRAHHPAPPPLPSR